MESRITLLVQPLPGLRLLGDGKKEDGSIIALRHDGDECLYVPRTEDEKGMEWIAIAQFSVDPEAVTPVDLLEQPSEEEQPEVEGEEGSESQETSSRSGPFGGHRLKRRTEVAGE